MLILIVNKITSILTAAFILAVCFNYPANGLFLLPLLVLYSLWLWRCPNIWLFVIPAALPIMDFSPITGLQFFNEFDLIVLTTISISGLKTIKSQENSTFPKGFIIMIALLIFSYCISAAIGMFPPDMDDLKTSTGPYSNLASLKSIKGFIEALLLIPLIKRCNAFRSKIKTFFIPGLLTGFGSVLFFTLWERQIFSGLFNFTNDYRITSTFFEMNTGGAFIDGYLSMILPFVFSCFLFWRGILPKLIGLILFSTGLYALLVTFSRICYASFIFSMLPLWAGITFTSRKKIKTLWFTIFIIITVLIISLPVLKGKFIQERFSKLSQSIGTRTDHWKDAVGKMDTTNINLLFGMGAGTYPKVYYQKNHNSKPGSYKIIDLNGNPFLRLLPGESLYFGQRISLEKNVPYQLTFKARSSKNGRLTFPICEKSILHSYNCNWKSVIIKNTNDWKNYKIIYPEINIGQGKIYQKRPVEFAVYNGNRNIVIDIDEIEFKNIHGENIIKNGDFTYKTDFWFFTVDSHLSWHIKNLWVSHFFEFGIIGLMVFVLFILYVLIKQIQNILNQDLFSLILFSGCCGFFVVGLIDSLFDSPRILFLFYFISFISLFYKADNNNKMSIIR